MQLRNEDGWTGGDEADIAALDEALTRLEEVDNRSCRVLELRFFAGMTEAEVGEVLGIAVPTVKRDFAFARAWLAAQLSAPPRV